MIIIIIIISSYYYYHHYYPLSSPRNFSVFNKDRDEDHNFLIIIIIIISSLIDHIIIILSPSLAISLFSTRIGMRIIIIIIWIVMVLTIIFISLVRFPKFIFQNGFGVLSVQYTVHTVSQRTHRQESWFPPGTVSEQCLLSTV